MTVEEAKNYLDKLIESGHATDELMIPNNKGGWGGISSTKVQSMFQGFDWNKGQVFVSPENKMIELKPNQQ